MSKAILIIDQPDSCAKCYFHECHYSLPLSTRRKGYICHYDKERRIMDLDYDDDAYKPDWCPLVPMPKKMGICGLYNTEYYAKGGKPPSYKVGWNACIDAIERSNTNE